MLDIKDDVKDALKEFRFRKSQKNTALICKLKFHYLQNFVHKVNGYQIYVFFFLVKVEKEKQKISVDEQIEVIYIYNIFIQILSN